jgi:thioesterase domain-containing protein/NAD(P)-dependent dehydrogenase (short-subunit alcohol dehydrogenase family)/acyl carrier protein
VLVTGGLGGIALALAERLAQKAQARFVLIGRSAVPAREEWPRLLGALDKRHPVAARIRGIQAIEAAGGEVLVVAADVSDRAQMAGAVAAAEARFGSIDAAIHAAGIIDDAPLVSKARERFESVLRPKVAGAVALMDALQGRALDFVVFFSSTSVVLGPAGQIDYVAANAFLNAYARTLAAQGVPAHAVQWGAWRDVGMAVAALAPGLSAAGETVPHALLQQRTTSESGVTTFAAILDSRSQWVLDEHRLRGAEPVLPGTAYVEMTRAAVAAAGVAAPGAAIELVDLAFTSPLVVPEKTPATVETEVTPGADGFATVTVRSAAGRGPATEHASGRGRLLPDWKPGTIDVAAIERRCTSRRESFAPGEQKLPQEALLAFGPRWKVLRSVAFGADEALAHLELADAHAADLESFALHPGLLDIASGCAFSLMPTDSGAVFVPLSYDRLRIAGPLPRHLVSHVRRRAESAGGVGILDVTLADASGRVVVEIDGYVVKAVDPAVLKGIRKADAPASPLEKWVEQGIGADEGFDLLARVLRQDGEVQMLVSPLDLHLMLAELRAPRRATPAAGSAAPAASAGAPTTADAPRDEIEQRLAGIWQELLGVDQVRLHDGFFDLGGHSLIAVRLFARVRKAWGIDLPLATLFRAPTLEALAAEVRKHLGLTLELSDASTPGAPSAAPAVQTGWTPLIEIRKGGASRRPFFCVHGAGGNLLNFLDFAKRLDANQAVFGLEARGVDGQQPPAGSIEEMADIYLEAIRRQQPHGPYVLGGYSGGGVVALEMARKLAAAGEPTSQVVLLDTFHPWTQAQEVGWSDRVDNLTSSAKDYLRGLFLRHVVWRSQNLRLKWHVRRGTSIPHELREWYVATAFIDCNRKYVPGTYTGEVTLFRASHIEKIFEHVGSRLGWTEELLPNLQVVEVPGTHDSLVREPNVSMLSKGLDEVLARASR